MNKRALTVFAIDLVLGRPPKVAADVLPIIETNYIEGLALLHWLCCIVKW